MPPAVRKQPSRNNIPQSSSQQNSTSNSIQNSRREEALNEFQKRRLARKLEDLERTNSTDIPINSFIQQSSFQKNELSIQILNQKKKQSSNVRKILYSKKSLKDWLDELPPDPPNPYLTSISPIPLIPSRKICSSCGYIGSYKCQRCVEWSCTKECMEIHERDGGCGIGG
ncbi:uncharacterized protein I206_105169 [Kwoniella pini CBS 10737]|uniref:HIT-type domain-containing protein n=1 Tax=Kwoniella pini CBS 10737 TaxID=1296096 RepID=A0A1B9I4Z9_9TREE|nr:uncharacterized protein I206_03921 [Kwoniella pini CBS 10737]OCF50596.1 hypothetical protein I206_03921 [Kwoniella pini CBS 10737]